MQIFIDESGFTGEDLFNPEQPIFSLASTNLSDSEAADLLQDLFSRTKYSELKHSSLTRSPRGQALSVELVKRAVSQPNRFAAFVAHKRFCLLAKLVDFWLESAMHETGFDLYKDGANIAFSNMAYLCLRTLESPEFLDRHLKNFQEMMRERTVEAYVAFWGNLDSDRSRAKAESNQILNFFFLAEALLGFPFLLELPKKGLDISFTVALGIIQRWQELGGEQLTIAHDASSNMAKEKWLWDVIVSPNVPSELVGYDNRTMKFPLGVDETVFVDSKLSKQVQICDILSGALATWGASKTSLGRPDKSQYCEDLDRAGIRELLCGTIWPVPEVDRRRKPARQAEPADPLDFFAKIVTDARSKR